MHVLIRKHYRQRRLLFFIPCFQNFCMAPLISVIIPAYNEEKYIGDCLTALNNQTLPRKEYELIVVNAKSKDRTEAIAKKLADKVIMEKRNSIGGARLEGEAAHLTGHGSRDDEALANADVRPPRFPGLTSRP